MRVFFWEQFFNCSRTIIYEYKLYCQSTQAYLNEKALRMISPPTYCICTYVLQVQLNRTDGLKYNDIIDSSTKYRNNLM